MGAQGEELISEGDECAKGFRVCEVEYEEEAGGFLLCCVERREKERVVILEVASKASVLEYIRGAYSYVHLLARPELVHYFTNNLDLNPKKVHKVSSGPTVSWTLDSALGKLGYQLRIFWCGPLQDLVVSQQ